MRDSEKNIVDNMRRAYPKDCAPFTDGEVLAAHRLWIMREDDSEPFPLWLVFGLTE